jgi:hypothetical protein
MTVAFPDVDALLSQALSALATFWRLWIRFWRLIGLGNSMKPCNKVRDNGPRVGLVEGPPAVLNNPVGLRHPLVLPQMLHPRIRGRRGWRVASFTVWSCHPLGPTAAPPTYLLFAYGLEGRLAVSAFASAIAFSTPFTVSSK